MKSKFALICLLSGALCAPVIVSAATDQDADRSHPKAFVKDSAITTKIKTKLAAEHLTSLGRIHVDTDADGVVYLSGTARTHEAIGTKRVAALANLPLWSTALRVFISLSPKRPSNTGS